MRAIDRQRHTNLALHIGNSRYEDAPSHTYHNGDILCAFNNRRIRHIHGESICHIRKAGFTRDGLRELGTLQESWFKTFFQYRFSRVSVTEIVRLDLLTGAEDLIGPKPNQRGEYINVPLFIARRRSNVNHRIFGHSGQEVWYGGKEDYCHEKLDLMWDDIENRSDYRETECTKWPASEIELKHFLFLSIDDCEDGEAKKLVQPMIKKNGDDSFELLKRRLHYVDWEGLAIASSKDVRNRTKKLDLRGKIQSRKDIVRTK